MEIDRVCRRLIEEFRSRPTLRAGSLITTVFGDAIAPRGGTLWLGSLIRILEDFGISERLVRTSVFRLASDGWLESEQRGRRSFYHLTGDGRERFRAATHRIYGRRGGEWDGSWCLLLVPALDAPSRDRLRRELGWQGFGSLSTNVLAHPDPDRDDLDAALARLGVSDDVVIMNAKTATRDGAMRRLAESSWGLDALDERYRRFVDRFRPALEALEMKPAVGAKTAFQLRTLLIQEYRKVLLRDPELPRAMLPSDWHGSAAFDLCRELYRHLYARADDYLTDNVETQQGSLPPPGGEFYERFGGLDPDVPARAAARS